VPGTAKRKHSFPVKVSDMDKFKLRFELEKVLKHVGNSMELDITKRALDIYHSWYMSMESSVHAKRLDTYAMRLMTLLAANDLKNEVDEETVRSVIQLCNWQLEVRKLYDPIDADNEIAKMEEKIRRQLRKKSLKDYQLKQYVNAHKGGGLWVYEAAKSNLQKANEIEFNKKKKRWLLISQKM
jgi:Mg-chelatase subunit ChlI